MYTTHDMFYFSVRIHWRPSVILCVQKFILIVLFLQEATNVWI